MRLVASLALCCVLPAFAHGQSGSPFQLPGKRAALLIGTDTYAASGEWPRLSSPVLDATALAKSLGGDFAFDTTVVRNASKDDIARAIVNHGKRLDAADDWSLVFVAAHGFFDDDRGQGYLVFRDSRPRGGDVSRSSYLSLTELRAMVEGFRAGHVLLIIDACYGGTIDPDIRYGTDRAERSGASRSAIESSLLRRSQYRSRMFLTSGGKEYVPDGRPGAHSPFAGALLGALRRASADGVALTFSQILGSMAESAIEPLPRHNTFRGHEPGGDFILLPRSFGTMGNAASENANREARAPTRTAETAPTARPRSASLAAPVVVKVDVRAEPGITRDLIISATGQLVQQALKERGVVNVIAVGAGASGSPRCTATGANADCIEVTVEVSLQLVNNRQSVLATLAAKWMRSQQFITSKSGRAGPFALDVPADRVVERAVSSVVAEFVDAVIGAVRP